MGRKSGLRMINSGKWAKHATIMITNELKAVAENTGVNVRLVIADRLKQSYRDNLRASYGPRSTQGEVAKKTHKRKTSTYTNTPMLEDAVDTVIEDNYVKIVIDKSVVVDGDRDVDAEKLLKWLRDGTKGGSRKKSKNKNPSAGHYTDDEGNWHYNYPTPPHPFEEHTANDMRSLLESMENDIKDGKYTTYRYTCKKKKRTHYRGIEIID